MTVVARAGGSHNTVMITWPQAMTAYDAAGAIALQLFDGARRPARPGDRIEIHLFEGRATRGGREIDLTRGEFEVVAVLAMQRQAASRDELCDELWPDRDTESAARLLKVYVHRIRTKFETNDVIETSSGGYHIGREVRVDVHSLATLARKVADGRIRPAPAQLRNAGRAFDGIKTRRFRRLARLESYPEWERRFLATGAELAGILVDDAVARGDAPRALALAEDLATLDPYDEAAAEVLIRAQLQLGRRDVAARYFRTFCRTLRADLDLPPPPQLVRLLRTPESD
jgi:DNA-binding SARP family transcriptional activator